MLQLPPARTGWPGQVGGCGAGAPEGAWGGMGVGWGVGITEGGGARGALVLGRGLPGGGDPFIELIAPSTWVPSSGPTSVLLFSHSFP